MKNKYPTLPQQIVKVSKSFYQDSRTGEMIHISRLGQYVNKTGNEELRDELIRSKRYDLNYD